MKIINTVNDKTVEQACMIVQSYYHDVKFYNSIKDEKFNSAKLRNTITGTDVYWEKLGLSSIVYVKPYRTWYPFSKVIGYAKGNTIFVNTRNLDLSLEDRVINIRHEIFHLEGFSHKGNTVNEFNLGTVPYKGSILFAKFLKSIGVL